MPAIKFSQLSTLNTVQSGTIIPVVYNGTNYKLTVDLLKGYVTPVWSEVRNKPSFAEVAFSGDYSVLVNKPTIPTRVSQLEIDVDLGDTAVWSSIIGKPTFATVATSGSYADLINKPNLAVYVTATGLTSILSSYTTQTYVTSQGYITTSSLTWNNITGKPTFATVATSGRYGDLSDKPLNLSDFNNDIELGGGGSTGTIWTNSANGCLRAELSETGFEAFTDASHLDLQDSGEWNIGSYQNSTFIGNDQFTNTNILSLKSGDETYITTNLRENGNHQWKFGTDGKLTLPSGNTRIGEINGSGSDGIIASTGTAFGVQTNNTLTNDNTIGINGSQFYTDVDIGNGFGVIDGWRQRNQQQIEINIFTAQAPIWSILIGASLGATVIVTYSTLSGNQTFTSVLSQQFTGSGQYDPGHDHGQRYSGRIDGTLPVGQTGIVSINFPTYATNYSNWTFSNTGTLTVPGDIVLPYGTIGSGTGDGIKLTTDRGTVLFGNSPEICGPTGSTHFHIMKQDPTLVDLFFGDDFNNLKLPTTGGVSLQAFNTQTTINSTWTFDGDGVLTLPSGNTRIGSLDGGGSDSILASTGTIFGIIAQGAMGTAGIQWIEDISSLGSTSTRTAAIAVNPFGGTTGTVQIVTGVTTGTGSSNTWEFGTGGSLTFPSGAQIIADSQDGTYLQANPGINGYAGLSSLTGNSWMWTANDGGAYISSSDGYTGGTWSFNTNSNLTIPGDIQDANGSVIRVASTSTAPTRVDGQLWFNNQEGRLYIKNGGVWLDASPTQIPSPETYLDGLAIDGTVISTANVDSDAIVIDGGDNSKLSVSNLSVTIQVPGGLVRPYWAAEFGGITTAITTSSYTVGTGAFYDSLGNVYVLGAVAYGDLGLNDLDSLLLKYDTNGNLLWSRTWHDNSGNNCGAVNQAFAIDSNDRIYWLATDAISGGCWTGYMDTDGNLGLGGIAQGSLGFNNAGVSAVDIACDNSGNYYLAGSYYDGNQTPVVIKVDGNSGAPIWTGRIIPEDYQDLPADGQYRAVTVNPATGDVWAIGDYNDNGNLLAMLSKWDINGVHQWTKKLVTSSGDLASAVIYNGGYVYTIVNDDGSQEAIVSKFDTDGDLIWASYLAAGALDPIPNAPDSGTGAYDLSFDAAGNVYVTGTIPGPPAGQPQLWITKLDPDNGEMLYSRILITDAGVVVIDQGAFGGGSSGHRVGDIYQDKIAVTAVTTSDIDDSTGTNETRVMVAQLPIDGSVTGTFGNITIGDLTSDIDSICSTGTYTVTTLVWSTGTSTAIFSTSSISVSYVTDIVGLTGETLALGSVSGSSTVTNTWTFVNNNIILPPGGDILDSNGVSVLGGATTSTIALPSWITVVPGTNHLPTLNTDYGWNSLGAWTVNATIGDDTEGTSYPFRTTFSIPNDTKSVTTVDFVVADFGADFGIGVFAAGTNPVWDWDPPGGNPSANRIGAQYNGSNPELHGISGGDDNDYDLPGTSTYRARLTVDPTGPGTADITLETLDTSNNVLDTISYTETSFFGTDYKIGFASDQDDGTPRTYFKNLTINVNNGATVYTDTLMNGSSTGGTTTALGDRLTAGSSSVVLGTDGVLTLPDGGTIAEGGGLTGAIRLTPAGGANAYQALLIYPTGTADGDHIHLTAGGGDTDLYLGNDDQFVKVDHSGTVVVQTYSTVTDNTWTFGTDGVLTLSTASTILGASSDPNVYIETATTATTSTWTFGTNGVLTLPAATPVIKGGGTGTDVTVIATTGTNTATWTFAADGSLTLPDATVQTTAWLGGGSSSLSSNDTASNNFNTGNFTNQYNLDIEYTAFTGDYGVNFDITYQKPLDSTKGVTVGAIETPLIMSTGTVILKTDISSSTSTWTFGTDGILTFPDGYLKIVPNGANPYIGNNTITDLGGGDSQSTISAISINQSVEDYAGITIDTSVTTILDGDPSLGSGSSINVNGDKIVLGRYTVNSLGGGGPSLFVQNKIEINNTATLIGQYVSNTAEGNTVTSFAGWTFGTDGDLTLPGQLLFPEGTTFYNNGISISSGTQYATNVQGNTAGINQYWFADGTMPTRKWAAVRVNSPENASTGSVVVSTGAFNSRNNWIFAHDGSTVLPENTLKGYCFTATNAVGNYIPQAGSFYYTDNPILRSIATIGGAWYIKGPGLVGWKQITGVQDNGTSLIIRIGSGNTPLGDGSEFHSGGYLPNSPDLVYTISQYLELDVKAADKTWTFSENGSVTFPDNTVQTTAYVPATASASTYTGWFKAAGTVVQLDTLLARINSTGTMQISSTIVETIGQGSAFAWNGVRNKGATMSSFGQGGTNWVNPGDWLDISATPLDNDFEVATVSVFKLGGTGNLYRITYVGSTNSGWAVNIERVAQG